MNLGFAECIEGVSEIKHGGASWGQKGVVCGVQVGPGQPAGQVGLEPLNLLLLLLEEQLSSNQTFIGALILPTGRRAEGGWCRNSLETTAWRICLFFTVIYVLYQTD